MWRSWRWNSPALLTSVKKKIKELALPPGSIFIAVIRGEEVIIPYGETEFQPEDKVLALVKRDERTGPPGDAVIQS